MITNFKLSFINYRIGYVNTDMIMNITKFILYITYFYIITFGQIIDLSKTCSASELVFDNNSKAVNHFICKDGYILINVSKTPPLYLSEQRKQAFRLLKPYLTNNIYKASVLWQKNNFSYGKIASIPNTYIREYLNNKIKENTFISLFTLQEIEPDIFSNIISNSNYNISAEARIKTVDLAKTAEFYRLNGSNDSAKRIYLQILEINPNDTIAIYWLAKIYKIENNPEKAREFYSRVLSIDPSFWAANEDLYELKK